jgi:hypothetical protein
MTVDFREIKRLQAAIAGIRRRVNAGRKDWIPALEMVIRELERLKSGRFPREREMPRRVGAGKRRAVIKKSGTSN